MEESGQIRLLFPLEGTSVPVGLEAGGTFEEGKYIVARLVLLHCHSFCLFLFGAIAPPPPVGHGILIHEVSRSHNDAVQSVGLLWTSDQLVAETSSLQHKTLTADKLFHASGGIRTYNLNRRAAADVRLRPRGYWKRHGEA